MPSFRHYVITLELVWISNVDRLDLHCHGINKLPKDIRRIHNLPRDIRTSSRHFGHRSLAKSYNMVYINTIQFIQRHFHQYSSLLQSFLLSEMPSPRLLSLLTEVPRMTLFFLRRTSAFPSRPCTAYAKRLYMRSQTYLGAPIYQHELTSVPDHYIPNTKIRYFPMDLNKKSHRRNWGHYPALANYPKRWYINVMALIE